MRWNQRTDRRKTGRAATLVPLLALVLAGCGGGDDEQPVEPGGTSQAATTAAEQTPEASGLSVSLDVGAVSADGAFVLVKPFISPNFVYFEVSDSAGGIVPFDGPWLSLRPLDSDDFVTLGPGESTTNEFDLAKWYELPVGTYSVTAEYRNPLGSGGSNIDAPIVDGVASPEVTVEIT